MKYAAFILVVGALCALILACVPAVTPGETPAMRELREHRIDWSVVPASGPYVEPKGPTANEQVFKRERHRAYAALQFERTK